MMKLDLPGRFDPLLLPLVDIYPARTSVCTIEKAIGLLKASEFFSSGAWAANCLEVRHYGARPKLEGVHLSGSIGLAKLPQKLLLGICQESVQGLLGIPLLIWRFLVDKD